jgi:hypothetical protein
MTNLEIKLYPKEFEVKSVDSVSQIGKELRRKARSSIASSSSKAGSTISARLAAKARKAVLEAEKAGLAKQQALEQERLQLEQRNYELKLNTELAKAKAEERVYSEGIYDEAQETPCKLKDHQAETRPEQTETKREEQYKHYKDFKSTRLGTTTTIRSDAGLGSHIRTQYPAKSMMQTSKAKESDASSEIAEEFLRSVTNIQEQQQHQMQEMFNMQESRDEQLQQLLSHHQQMALSMTLPNVQVPTFAGDPIEYCHFVRSFENLIEAKTASPSARLFYLIQYTSGEVQDLMRSCLTMHQEEGYREARRLLKEKYGQNYKIAAAYINRITQVAPIKAENAIALQNYSVLLVSCKNTLKEIGYLNKVENPDSLVKIIEKLPFALRQKWREIADDITNNKSREITFDDVVKFIESRARVQNHPIFGRLNSDTQGRSKGLSGTKNRFNFGIDGKLPNDGRVDNSRSEFKSYKCPMCNGNHILPRCSHFQKESLEGRRKFVRKRGLCDNCWFQGHIARSCPKESFCRVTGCHAKHSTYLHPKGNPRFADKSSGPDSPNISDNRLDSGFNNDAQNGCVNATKAKIDVIGAGVSTTGLPLVPVKVRCPGTSRVITTYAFLDAGSNTTFCTNELLNQVGVQGKRTTLSLTTLQSENCAINCTVNSLEVFDLNEDNMVELPIVFSTERLPVNESSIPRQEDVNRWQHLKGVKLQEIDASIGLLIGNDVPKALEPKEVRECIGRGPYAVRTVLGWTINGPLGRNETVRRCANLIRSDHGLNEQFRKYCDMEFNDSSFDNQLGMSVEDSRALGMMEGSVQLKDGHYEVALPWRNFPPCLPNNRSLAEHRLNLLKKRLVKNPDLLSKYAEFMDNMLDKGYARKVPKRSIDQPQQPLWYLPHHPVINPNKPDKVRVVFDCAVVFHGTSLNHELLQGPDFTNSLVGVLIRFRENSVALMADIESMFHQVHVAPSDYDALRFLWWPENDLEAEPQEFQMLVHLFGATSSPSCANFALQRTADDNSKDFGTKISEIVKRNFYVDDCLKSVSDDEEGVSVANDLTALLARGGFHLTKWISNSAQVIASIPEEERSGPVKDLSFDQPTIQRALGVNWDVVNDEFGFKVTIKEKQPTRRGLLSIVSSVYDPLGFTAPVILSAKILMQELCRSKLSWDEPIEAEHLVRWNAWLKELPKIEQLHVPRCVRPSNTEEFVSTQLHTFADASQRGYGAVTYLRFEDSKGNTHCSFVIAKSRVAPLKETTIPRLELSAAVVATRLDRMVRKESDIHIDASLFWTDSTCVLGYLNSQNKRFQTFVANRIAAIHEVSSPIQWRYVNSEQNPADDASRGLSAEALLTKSRWINGPEFLWKPQNFWPRQPTTTAIRDDDPEVKLSVQAFSTVNSSQVTMDAVLERFSSWERLKRFVAWILRYRANLRKATTRSRKTESTTRSSNPEIEPLTVEEMLFAEKEIVKYVQGRSYQEELSRLNYGNIENDGAKGSLTGPVKKTSPIYKLDPQVKGQLLCVGGRLANAPIPEESKHPLIIPKDSPISKMIARYYHQLAGHSGLEHVLSLIRERFWIVGARNILKEILRSCVDCRRRQAPVGEQKMADLPQHRVTPDKPPFACVGVDCFGPFLVKRGRSLVKRYGVLFTCLAVRAVHIEVIQSLDTSSFLHALRRFIARRGKPEVIRSDNGSNFVSGEKEIRSAIENWNQEKIHQFLLQQNVKWIFNPPLGSHHGGVWERCIRTVRKILLALLKQQTVDDECLTTVMCEVESIMNSRPLTKVSDDPSDLEALTPNHLLLLQPGPSLPPGIFRETDLYCRRRWRQAQYLSDVFWRRWLKEYLPELQRRQKWMNPRRNFVPGDVVLLVDETSPRSSWPLGRILRVKPNTKDGYVRRVILKTKSTVLERPVDKIVLLEASP